MSPKTQLSRTLWSLLFPINCLGCGRESDWICPSCLSELSPTRPERCAICGKAGQHRLCGKCQAFTKLDGLVSLFPYSQPEMKGLIRAVKYHGHLDGLEFFFEHFRLPLLKQLPAQDWVVQPIPLNSSRTRERGFNQSLLLAQGLRSPYSIGSLLQRSRPTAPQAQLPKEERLKNVRDCFSFTGQSAPEAVLLIDDVITTGATMREAAKVLRKNGTETIWALTIAHG